MSYYLITHHFINTNHVTLELVSGSNSSDHTSLGMIGLDSNGVVRDESALYQAFNVENYTNTSYETRGSTLLSAEQAAGVAEYAANLIGQNTSGNDVDLLSDILDEVGKYEPASPLLAYEPPLSSFFEGNKASLSFAYASILDFFTKNSPNTLDVWANDRKDIDFNPLKFEIDPIAINWFVDNYGAIPTELQDLELYEYAYNTLVSKGYNGVSSEEFSQFDYPWGSLEAFVDEPSCPLVIDLDHDGIETISRADSEVQFDIDGDGQVDQVAWLNGDDGFLSLDQNGNGIIDDVSEMFGGQERGEGFAQLATLDSNGDGIVSDLDNAFSELLIWVDANVNGQTDEGELASLAEYGINQLNLDYTSTEIYQEGNLIGEVSSAEIVGVETQLSAVYFVHDSIA
ncbi:hypothetical protein MGA5115_03014 [Marinomonas gallaica]|uniref:Uncharacterized protein n=1 Tax=Marinomonas gallaica TaxID=1806667 RepID=A0A1C3JUH0_9GAMM|nr:hypothetical protein [Marinomonas gallaica]SBT18853.1 hypothetical protein MGA5115_03014 [Marinomonas gallaica]SBT21808.1 hypothetical protein MGA5116_02418 [Marinomonas gallaica]